MADRKRTQEVESERTASNEDHSPELVAERRGHIFDVLQMHGRVRVRDLAERFHVSQVTIREDLSAMQRQGQLRRTHGGAILNVGTSVEMDFNRRAADHREVKERLAAMVACRVREEQTIILDAGSTAVAIAKAIAHISTTVITPGLNVAMALRGHQRIHVFVLGGHLVDYALATCGPEAENQLKGYHADLAILGIPAFDTIHGLSEANVQMAAIKRHMIAAADRSILVADASKYGRTSMSIVCPLNEIDEVVTDRDLPLEAQQAITRTGVNLTLA